MLIDFPLGFPKAVPPVENVGILQGVPYHWAHFVFAIFSGSRAHIEELFIAIG